MNKYRGNFMLNLLLQLSASPSFQMHKENSCESSRSSSSLSSIITIDSIDGHLSNQTQIEGNASSTHSHPVESPKYKRFVLERNKGVDDTPTTTSAHKIKMLEKKIIAQACHIDKMHLKIAQSNCWLHYRINEFAFITNQNIAALRNIMNFQELLIKGIKNTQYNHDQEIQALKQELEKKDKLIAELQTNTPNLINTSMRLLERNLDTRLRSLQDQMISDTSSCASHSDPEALDYWAN